MPRTGDPDTFESFDQLVDAFIAQADHAVGQIVKASRIRDELYATHLPAPLISAFMQGCLEQKRDVTHGGAFYDRFRAQDADFSSRILRPAARR